ncbi:diguanylate cyclase domain-containing protein [Kineococcus indalonis]|uniref:diguanylate cyclase domain-containing protein n=1 Tax=Kineococcus indalonis TaxID=2696566 RepID=UPI0014121DAD|nr:diguanylate cyclase [Kineococcus indalonis]NAZ86500.1 diguanylate cyclase [Kineococcus indalonis]
MSAVPHPDRAQDPRRGPRPLAANYARSLLLPRPRGAVDLPRRRHEQRGVRTDPARLAAWARVCGFPLRSRLPLPYPHLLGFPAQVELLVSEPFPFRLLGLVHVAQEFAQRRPLAVDEELDVSVRAVAMRPHRRGALVELVTEVRGAGDDPAGDPAWRGVSRYLAPGARLPGAVPPADADPAAPGAGATATRWRVGAGTGRRYAEVSGDVNPLHLAAPAARLLGFRRALAHGVWTASRSLAVLDGRLPGAVRADVRFKAPLLLPAGAPRAVDRRTRAARAEWAAALVVSAAVAAAVFWRTDSGPWPFLVVVPVLWGAARLGLGRALSCLLVVALLATAGTTGGTGPYAGFDADARTAVLEALLFTCGAVTMVMSLVVRARERAVVEAGRREELFRRTFDDALLGVALLRLRADGTAVVARVNDRLRSMLGHDVEVGSDWSQQVHGEHRAAFVEAVHEMVERVRDGRDAHWHAEVQHGEGEVWLELAASAWPTWREDGRAGEVAAVVQVVDVTQRRLVQRKLREAALHDALTGLPNRTLLEDRLRHALGAASRSGRRVALLYCDLDDFKPVNDTGGHAAGDHVLIGVAQRLGAAVRPGDTVARLGGDEFAVVCPDLPDASAAEAVAERIVAAMAEPFRVAGWEFPVGISVGLSIAARGADAHRVLQEADAAMYEAKAGKGERGRAPGGGVRAAGARVVDLRAVERRGR